MDLGTAPWGPQDSIPGTLGPDTGTGPQLGSVTQHRRDCIPAQGQSPTRGWHPNVGMAPRPAPCHTRNAAHPAWPPPPPDSFLPVTDKMLLGFQGGRSPVPHPGSGL